MEDLSVGFRTLALNTSPMGLSQPLAGLGFFFFFVCQARFRSGMPPLTLTTTQTSGFDPTLLKASNE